MLVNTTEYGEYSTLILQQHMISDSSFYVTICFKMIPLMMTFEK